MLNDKNYSREITLLYESIFYLSQKHAYLFEKEWYIYISKIHLHTLYSPPSNTRGCEDPFETSTGHPGLCPPKSLKPVSLSSFSFLWFQFKYRHLRAMILTDHPGHFSSFPPPPLLYHICRFYLLYFLFTSPPSPILLLIHLFEGCLFPPLKMKQGPCLINKQKGIPKIPKQDSPNLKTI